MKTLETLYGQTNGTSTTGVFSLLSELMEQSSASSAGATSLVIPKGIRAKIWLEKVVGAPCSVFLTVNANPTNASVPGFVMPSNTNVTIDSANLSAAGTIELDTRHPVIITARNPLNTTYAIAFSWSQSTAAVSSVIIMIEWSTIDEAEYAE